MDHDGRRDKVQKLIKQEGLDAVLITNPVNATYLTGFSGDSSYLVLTGNRAILVSDGRFTEQIAEECPGLERHIRPPSQPLTEAAADVLGKLGLRALGFETGHLTVAEFEKLRDLVPAVDWKGQPQRVEELRMLKDAEEVAEIREAIRIAERAFTMFRAMLRPEDCEKDLVDALETYVRRAGGQGTAFPPIVAVGDRSALPHAPASQRRVEEGNLLLVDWGATGRLYKSDLTRVLLTHNKSAFYGSAGGESVAGKLREVYAVVQRAQERAMSCVRPGAQAQEVDAAARAVMAQAGYGDFFNHGLGHGLGLQIHEAPFCKPGNDLDLQAGMVMTIEPGIYLPGWGGIRLEDDVLVTPQGCEVLTSLPRDLEANSVAF